MAGGGSRKPPARGKRAPAKGKRAPAKGKRRPTDEAPDQVTQSWWRRAWAKFIWFVSLCLLLLGIGVSIVAWVQYQQARATVEEQLAKSPWPGSGYVVSGPLELWEGMALDGEALATELQAAGYSLVDRQPKEGEFRYTNEGVELVRPALEVPGHTLSQLRIEIQINDGILGTISPDGQAIVGVVELAELRQDNESRKVVSIEELPPHLTQAVLAMEDARFYDHEGLDPLGIVRAVGRNVLGGGPMQGGSTLTQQVVKNLFLTSERTYERKAEEALMAVALERIKTKDEILAYYLNEIYWGQAGGVAICGVETAAQVYFGKPASRLSITESATLAGIISAPNLYSPLRHPEAAKERRDIALLRMVQAGFLLEEEREALLERPLEVAPVKARRGLWTVEAAIEEVEGRLGKGTILAENLTVHTGLHPVLQKMAEEAVRGGLTELAKSHPEAKDAQAALVAVRVRDGAILAMVGGRDVQQSAFNRAMDSRRHIGSTVKPLTALVAFDADSELGPHTSFLDAPIVRDLGGGRQWEPKNYDQKWQGETTLRETIAKSRNIPAILLAEAVGMDELAGRWRDLGLTGAISLPSAALGAFEGTPLELAGAYTAVPGAGIRVEPRLILGVEGVADEDRWEAPEHATRFASPRAAFLTQELLKEVVKSGTGRKLSSYGLSGELGGKTGTTDEARDAWFVGFTRDVVIAVWVGQDQGEALGLGGATAALPIWARFVRDGGLLRGALPGPSDVEEALICPDSGQLWQTACPAPDTDWFSAGATPQEPCWIHEELVDEERDRFRLLPRPF